MNTNDKSNCVILLSVVNDKFSDWLIAEMNKKEWSQAELANAANVSKGAISHLLSGTRQPGPELLAAIAKAFKLPPETVFRAAGILPPAPPRDARKEIILHLADQLPDEEYDDLVAYIEMRLKLARERGKIPNASNAQSNPAARSA